MAVFSKSNVSHVRHAAAPAGAVVVRAERVFASRAQTARAKVAPATRLTCRWTRGPDGRPVRTWRAAPDPAAEADPRRVAA